MRGLDTTRTRRSFAIVAAFFAVFVIGSIILMPTSISAQFTRADKTDTNEKNLITNGGTLRIEKVMPINMIDAPDFAPQVVDPQSIFSNVTTFTGSAGLNGGAALVGANTITRLMADDLQPVIPYSTNAYTISGYRFNVANFDVAAVSARPRIRFYANNGAGGAPGTYLSGNTFNAISFGANTVTTYGATSGINIPVPAGTTFIWAGITFDNNSGATGATAAQLNNLGQGTYNPPNRGISADLFFRTTAAGDFVVHNPAGAIETSPFAGAPVANFGWELLINAPTAAGVSISGQVLNGSGEKAQGIANAVVTIVDSSGNTRVTRTNSFGYYSFDDIEVGQTYVFYVSAKRYQFGTQALSINNEVNNYDFTPIE